MYVCCKQWFHSEELYNLLSQEGNTYLSMSENILTKNTFRRSTALNPRLETLISEGRKSFVAVSFCFLAVFYSIGSTYYFRCQKPGRGGASFEGPEPCVCSTWPRALFLKETKVNYSFFEKNFHIFPSVVIEYINSSIRAHLLLNLATLLTCLSIVIVLNNRHITWKSALRGGI